MSELKERTYNLWDVAIAVPTSSTIKGHVWLAEELGAMQAIEAFAAKHGADAGTLRYAEAELNGATRTVREAAP